MCEQHTVKLTMNEFSFCWNEDTTQYESYWDSSFSEVRDKYLLLQGHLDNKSASL